MHGRPASPRKVVGSDFRLYHSSALEVLAGLLAEQVAELPADGDWLRPDVVLVPQFSMRRWLQQVLAERLGICANLKFLTPGEFVDFALLRAHLSLKGRDGDFPEFAGVGIDRHAADGPQQSGRVEPACQKRRQSAPERNH